MRFLQGYTGGFLEVWAGGKLCGLPVDEPIEDESFPIPEESPVIDPSSLTYDDLKKICADSRVC